MTADSTRYAIGLGVAAAAAAASVCSVVYCSHPDLVAKAQRWVSRNVRLDWRRLAPEQLLEPGEAPWPADGFPGPPRCRPLSTVTELLTWQPPAAAAAAATAAAPAAAEAPAAASLTAPAAEATAAHNGLPRPQLLVCHDMMGGYLDYEALMCGSSDATEYRLWHWDCIDVFVYFSHHLVTIPPQGWIHAAHKHGVKVLGTFITEFGQGRLRCDRLFSSYEGARQVADQLVAIAAHHGFEGWLVNIENPLTPQQVSIMQHFVGYLRARTRDTCAAGLVVWYDAVTTAGKLNWQNGLTALNAPFFDLSDGLFVNYTWTPEQLPATVAAAGGRLTSVYMGVDVFGRGSYGGGGFGVSVALAAAKAAGLSAALFAPGWVRENLDRSHFHELQDKWWTQVQQSWGSCHAVVTQLPFSTSFNTGAGLATFAAGAPATQQPGTLAEPTGAAGTIADGSSSSSNSGVDASSSTVADGSSGSSSWYNMCETDTLPCVRDPVTQQVVTQGVCGILTARTAYEGGSCLVLYQTSQAGAAERAESAAAAPTAVAAGATDAAADGCSPEGSSQDSTANSCCCPVVPQHPTGSSSGSPNSSSNQEGQQLALLQLFTAHVPVQHDAVVTLSCVYAAPLPQGPTAAAAEGANNARTEPAADADGAVSSSTQGVAWVGSANAPTLWIMTTTTTGNVQVQGTAATALAGATRLLHLPVFSPQEAGTSSSSSSRQPVIGPVLSAAGHLSDVQVQYLPQPAVTTAGTGSGTSVQVQLLQPATDVAGGAVGTDTGAGGDDCAAATTNTEQPGSDGSSNSSSSSSSAGLPSWLTSLPAEVGTWQWQQVTCSVPVAAGSVVSGTGVAVPLSSATSEHQGRSGSGSSGWEAMALIGRVEIACVF